MKYVYKRRPFRHQHEALLYTLQNDAAALLMDPGTGKTKVGVDNIGCRYLRGEVHKVLIVCPRSLRGVWEEHIVSDLPDDIPRLVLLPESTKEFDTRAMKRLSVDNPLVILVLSYESNAKIYEKIKRWQPDEIIIDESHYIKTQSAHRSRALHHEGPKSKFRIMGSGTPITKYPLDVYSQFKFLAPWLFDETWDEFRRHYALWGGYYGREVIGYQNLKELARKVHSVSYRARIEDVLELPQRLPPEIIPVKLPKKIMGAYTRMEQEGIVKLGSGRTAVGDNVLTLALRLHQLTGGFLGTDEGNAALHTEKLDACLELTGQHIEVGNKVVVFCAFRWEIEQVTKACSEQGYHPLTIMGGMSEKVLNENKRKFQEEEQYKVLVCQIDAGGFGHTFTAANVAIFYSFSNRWESFKQAHDRIYRHGQTKRTYYYYLIVRDTIDEVMLEAMHSKKRLSDMILNYFNRRGNQHDKR